MATQSTPKPPQTLCVVSVGYTRILLPADIGLKLAGLLRGAVEVSPRYDTEAHREIFEIDDELQVEYSSIKADQVRRTAAQPPVASPVLALSHELPKLPRPSKPI
jgi:hypothetical protein